MERRRFTAELQREAVTLAEHGEVSRAKVVQKLGLNVNMLARWIRQAKAGKWSFLELDRAYGSPSV